MYRRVVATVAALDEVLQIPMTYDQDLSMSTA